jgi:predicted DNA-binding protein (MmcQ/YjbR family)
MSGYAMAEFLQRKRIRRHTLKAFLLAQAERVKKHALAMGAEAQRPYAAAIKQRFFVPPYVGSKGWIGLRLDVHVDWCEVADFVNDSYQMTAPKRLVALLAQRQLRR